MLTKTKFALIILLSLVLFVPNQVFAHKTHLEIHCTGHFEFNSSGEYKCVDGNVIDSSSVAAGDDTKAVLHAECSDGGTASLQRSGGTYSVKCSRGDTSFLESSGNVRAASTSSSGGSPITTASGTKCKLPGGSEVDGTPLAVKTDVNGDGVPDECIPDQSGSDIETNPIIKYLKGIINFLAIGVGVVTAISIVVAGVQYTASRGNPQAIQSAQQRIWNGVIAMLLFIFMYAILNFLVPGGLIG